MFFLVWIGEIGTSKECGTMVEFGTMVYLVCFCSFGNRANQFWHLHCGIQQSVANVCHQTQHDPTIFGGLVYNGFSALPELSAV